MSLPSNRAQAVLQVLGNDNLSRPKTLNGKQTLSIKYQESITKGILPVAAEEVIPSKVYEGAVPHSHH